ncbi:hypothetical protein L9F63_007035 [Diploptera punctata]|uniref:Phospholipase B1, membrane-associated n=1 Tax=Diploptera punctata TaxID=6984 RepID=A0AAD8E3N4_DIPPU|nr:hypothetical protein L9F63_007035 [Diploptera punctata]
MNMENIFASRSYHLKDDTKNDVRRQQVYSISKEFPCRTEAGSPGSRSAIRPTSVHQLRPGDIDVVAAMGDSLIAGNGAVESFAMGAIFEHRGVSWCAGGQGSWRKYLTLPNILKEFNPNLLGYSNGSGDFLSSNSRLNVAIPISATEDALQQAKLLVSRMKNDPKIDFYKHWKMVTIMFGANDLCSSQCFNRKKGSATQHQRFLRGALDYLHKYLPRTFVNLVPVIDVTISVRIKRTRTCRLLHNLFCMCFHWGGDDINTIAKLVQKYQSAINQLVSSGRYDTKEDFTVVLQPFIQSLNVPLDKHLLQMEAIHISYITHDCFHFSQKGHALAANLLWNNVLEPVGNKSQQLLNYIMEKINCPSTEAPYLFTNINSQKFLESGRQML